MVQFISWQNEQYCQIPVIELLKSWKGNWKTAPCNSATILMNRTVFMNFRLWNLTTFQQLLNLIDDLFNFALQRSFMKLVWDISKKDESDFFLIINNMCEWKFSLFTRNQISIPKLICCHFSFFISFHAFEIILCVPCQFWQFLNVVN